MPRRGRPRKEPLRALTADELSALQAVEGSRSQPADVVRRANVLMAVASGASYLDVSKAHRCRRQTVSEIVTRFNKVGMKAVAGVHGGGHPRRYGDAERDRILREFARKPDREKDGTATWSVSTLQKSLRKAEDGLSGVSTFVIFSVLREAGHTWQRDRSWCHTGTVERKRKEGVVTVTDPLADEKRGS